MQLCCIFLLLFAQQSALTHAAWHAFGAAGAPEQRAAVSSQDGSPPVEAVLCAFDAAYGQVLGAAAGSAPMTAPPALAAGAPLQSHAPFTVPQFLAPLSRGPPSLR